MAIRCPTCRSDNPVDSRSCQRCGTPFELDFSPTMTYSPAEEAASREALRFQPGEKFGQRYTIIEEIGHGGMGRLYKARDHELDTVVVLKMIRPELSARPGMVDQFRKETLIGRSIPHENIVRIHDLGETHGVRYISMDYIRGENVYELIRRSGSLTLSTCLHIAVQVCGALQAAHRAGFVHQDLKPQNIMIDDTGKVFITDFGLARSLASSRPARSGKISGTPKYFSPEQARGEESDPRSDIYSLGTILYEMVTGAPPFRAEDAEGYARKHISERPVPPSRLRPDLPPACERLILKCLEKDREDRYQSVDDLIRELDDQVLASTGDKGRRLRRRIAAAVAVAAVGAAAWLWIVPGILPPRREGPPLVAVLYAVNNTGDKSLDGELRWGITHHLSTFLNQSRYLRVLRQDRLMQILTDMGKLDEEFHLSKTLDRISEATNIGYFILPSFARTGDDLWVSASVVRAKTDVAIGEPDTAKGNKDRDLLAMLETLSQKAKAKLDLSPEEIAGDFNQSLDRITTTSPEALRHYTDGEMLYARGDFASSVKALEMAVREDPGFAMAYLRMADSYEYLGDYARWMAALQKAQSLTDRVSIRDRYFIQGYSSSVLDESPAAAIESYRKLIEIYPDDKEARGFLGAIYRNLEEWNEAIAQFDRILEVDPADSIALENKAFIYTALGRYDKAVEICQDRPGASRENPFFIRQVPLVHLIRGRFDLAAPALEKAAAQQPESPDILEIQGHFHRLRGDLAAAESLYDRLRETGESPDAGSPDLSGRIWSAQLSLQKGRFQQALDDIRQGIELARRSRLIYDEFDLLLLQVQIELRLGRYEEAARTLGTVSALERDTPVWTVKRSVLFLRGLAEAGGGRLLEAKRTAEELRLALERSGPRHQMRSHDYLLGRIALAEGRADQAVRHFERALISLPRQRVVSDEQAFFMDGSADALYRAGRWRRAADACRGIASLTTGRLSWGDLYAKSFYRLGKIHQKTGDTSAAAKDFEEFLRLWKDADPGLPEVVEARELMRALSAAR